MDDNKLVAMSDAIYFDTSALVKIDKEEGDSSRLVRALVYGSTIKAFSSYVGFGELIGKFGQKGTQKYLGGTIGFLYHCRGLMFDFEIEKIRRIEPPRDKVDFIRNAQCLCAKHGKLGGGDIWHLMSVSSLLQEYPSAVLFSYDNNLVEAASDEAIRAVYGNNLEIMTLINELKSLNKWIGA